MGEVPHKQEPEVFDLDMTLRGLVIAALVFAALIGGFVSLSQ